MARLTVQFPERTSEILAELTAHHQVSKSEMLRRALGFYKFLEQETRDGKHKIAIVDENDRIIKEIVLTV